MFTTSNITILGYAVITREEFGNLSDFDWWQVEVPICLEREIQLQSLGMFCISEFSLNLCTYSCLTFNKPIRTVASLVFQKVKKLMWAWGTLRPFLSPPKSFPFPEPHSLHSASTTSSFTCETRKLTPFLTTTHQRSKEFCSPHTAWIYITNQPVVWVS